MRDFTNSMFSLRGDTKSCTGSKVVLNLCYNVPAATTVPFFLCLAPLESRQMEDCASGIFSRRSSFHVEVHAFLSFRYWKVFVNEIFHSVLPSTRTMIEDIFAR